MKSTSFCLNYASSVSFLNLFLRRKIAWFCVTAFGSYHSRLCSCLSHLHLSTLHSQVSSFIQGRRKGLFVKAGLINEPPDLTGVSDRTKDMKRGGSLGKGEQSHCYLLVRHRMSTDPIRTFLYLYLEEKPLHLKTTNVCR